jgi:hypothetical protein
MATNPLLLKIENYISQLSKSPSQNDREKYKAWLAQKSFISFLKNNIAEEDIILFLSIGNPQDYIFMYGVLVPNENLEPVDSNDLLGWGCNPTLQWGIRMWPDDWNNAEICSPFDFSSTKTLTNANQVIFLRSFEGRVQDKTYFDVSETLSQPHGLHFVPERSAFCRIDENGNNDPEKYTITDTYITCRNSWTLECYHINEANQIFTYLIYLSRLPYQEQQYWLSFNENPKGGISRSALLTDFKGQVDLSYEPLTSLKGNLKALHDQKIKWWKMKNISLLNELHYPITGSVKEWSDAIHTLNKIINEGISDAFFKEKLKILGVRFDTEDKKKWGSIRLIKEYIKLKKPELENKIYDPLFSLNLFRTKFHGHVSGGEAKQIRTKIIRDHGSLLAKFKTLVARCDHAAKLLKNVIEQDIN